MADQLSLRLEADQLPDLPDLRPMLPRPLPAPFDSDEHLFEPWWGGERALVAIGPATLPGGRRGRIVRDAAGAMSAPRCPSWPGWPSGSRRARRSSTASWSSSTRPGERTRGARAAAGGRARAAGRRSSPSTCSTSTAARCWRSVAPLDLDSDPVVTGTTAITNTFSTTQHITLLFTLPITAIPGATLTGGSFRGTVTDRDGDGATLATFGPGTSFYTALIDGADWQTLYAHNQSVAAGQFLSSNVPSTNFGSPIPSLLGPPALTTIGIRIDFTLDALRQRLVHEQPRRCSGAGTPDGRTPADRPRSAREAAPPLELPERDLPCRSDPAWPCASPCSSRRS